MKFYLSVATEVMLELFADAGYALAVDAIFDHDGMPAILYQAIWWFITGQM